MKIAFLFPGYGSQYIGMGKEFYDKSRVVQEYFEIASSCLGVNFVKLFFAESEAVLGKPENAYPALFLLSAACTSVLKEYEIEPEIVAGKDIGVFAAAFASGAINLVDGLYITSKWGHLYGSILPTLPLRAHTINKISYQVLAKLCKKVSTAEQWVKIVQSNPGLQHIVIGHEEALVHLSPLLKEHKTSLKKASLNAGLFLPILEEQVGLFSLYFPKIDCKEPLIPVVHTHSAEFIVTVESLKKMLITYPVVTQHWDKSIEAIINNGATHCIIPFPDIAMLDQLKELYPSVHFFTLSSFQDLITLQEYMHKEKGETL